MGFTTIFWTSFITLPAWPLLVFFVFFNVQLNLSKFGWEPTAWAFSPLKKKSCFCVFFFLDSLKRAIKPLWCVKQQGWCRPWWAGKPWVPGTARHSHQSARTTQRVIVHVTLVVHSGLITHQWDVSSVMNEQTDEWGSIIEQAQTDDLITSREQIW